MFYLLPSLCCSPTLLWGLPGITFRIYSLNLNPVSGSVSGRTQTRTASSVEETAGSKAEAGKHVVRADDSRHPLHKVPYGKEVEQSRGWTSAATLGSRTSSCFFGSGSGTPLQSRQGSELFIQIPQGCAGEAGGLRLPGSPVTAPTIHWLWGSSEQDSSLTWTKAGRNWPKATVFGWQRQPSWVTTAHPVWLSAGHANSLPGPEFPPLCSGFCDGTTLTGPLHHH